MTRRAFRVLLFLGLLGTAALAGYQGWRLERARVRQLASAGAFDALTLRLAQSVIDLRASERAYVSAGQGFAYWKPRVDTLLQQIRQDLTTLKSSGVPGADSAADAAIEALGETARLEKRIAEAAEAGRVQFAADLVYADGLQASLALERATNAALLAAKSDLAEYQREARIQELLLGAESACIGLFLALMWFPSQKRPASASVPDVQTRPISLGLDLPLKIDPNPARSASAATTDLHAAPISPVVKPPPAPPPVPVTLPVPDTSREALVAAADLCTSLARVTDSAELGGLLGQVSRQLDASGVIVWLVDPQGLSLRPVLSHGYPAEAMGRLGRLDLTSDNATARAFRLVRPQTVAGRDAAPGAIVVPITTGAGCVGAVAAELRHGREQDAGTLALARIFAAQLASLTGPAASSGQTSASGQAAGTTAAQS